MESTNSEYLGNTCVLETKIKTENNIDWLDAPVKTNMFDGIHIIVYNSELKMKGLKVK